jgi:hypothetical protein
MADRRDRRKLVTLPATYKPGFLARMNQRQVLGRTLKERVGRIVADRGGVEGLSYVQASRIQRFVFLEALIEFGEQRLARGEAIDIGTHVQAINTHVLLGERIGSERKPRNVRTLADVMRAAPRAIEPRPEHQPAQHGA